MLVDGNSLTYRAFFALPSDMATASGQVTNAVFGFTSMMINLVRDHGPDRVIVAFDRPEPTFRHERVPTYKAQRDEAPDILRQQMGLVRQVVEVLGLPVVELPGFEADDLIATLAEHAVDRGDDVLVVTGDRDAYQLVRDPSVRVLYNKRGVSDYALYDEAGIAERTGVTPDRYVDYAALRGDPSDNLPGVPGVGEKTAAKLINAYGDAAGVIEHAAEQTPKLSANLQAHADDVRSNVEMMRLVRDVPLPVDLDELDAAGALGSLDGDAVRELFEFLEFRSLLGRLEEAFTADVGASRSAGEVLEAELELPESTDQAVDALERLQTESQTEAGSPLAIAAGWSAQPGRSPLIGMALVVDASAASVLWLGADLLDADEVRDALGRLVDEAGRQVVAHEAKALMRSLLAMGVDVRRLAMDTAIAAYLLDPGDATYRLGELAARHGQVQLPDEDEAPEGQLDLGGDTSGATEAQHAGRRALAVDRIAGPLTEALRDNGLASLHDDVEVPLVRVLARMEHLGVGVDVEELRRLNDEMAAEVERLTQLIWKDAGGEFNVNSTPQLREVLFDRLGLTPQKKTKTGYSTDAATLERLAGEHPIVEHLLRYREVEKLRSTYGASLLEEVAADGRIHATFHQTVARTGRLSSDQPNLHNIPVRTEEGRAFRRAFVPASGFELLVADYNQIELRCIAHLAEDPGLIAAFESGTDIHAETAARIFDTESDAVTGAERSTAKMVSYGLAYGMEAYGLGQRLGIPTGDAAEILDAYFTAFPAVRSYMDRTVAEARERGYTETLFGRRRRIPELTSGNHRIRQAGERQAMNAGIQGLAADIFKVALVRLDRSLDETEGAGRLILQVHDEVMVEVRPDARSEVSDLVAAAMSGAFSLRVPLEVHLAVGTSWADAKA
jgi:DNA polymerase-1